MHDPFDEVASWVEFYYEVFKIGVNPSAIMIPQGQSASMPTLDQCRLRVVAEVNIVSVVDECLKHFYVGPAVPEWLQEEISHNDRDPKVSGAYATFVSNEEYAHKNNKYHSANRLQERGRLGETFLERMLDTLKHFVSTGKRLGVSQTIERRIMCTGSRYKGGGVPVVFWNSDGLITDLYNPDHYADARICSCEVAAIV